MRAPPALVATACLLASACGGGAASDGSAGAPDQPGIAGRYLVTKHLPGQSAARPPARPVVIAVFRHAVPLAGPIRRDAERPLLRVRSGADGRFRTSRLRPGRYFVMALGVRELAPGRWVRLRRGRVARVVLEGCGDCLRPLGPAASGTS